MQNEPNFGKAQMNVNKVLTKDYENIANWTLGENEPKTNPIQSQTKPKQSQYKVAISEQICYFSEIGRLNSMANLCR